ncbi:hypothetical protein CHU32_05780 [Superficieibacter electus]|uniref:DUF4231 domain-containing protein n=1 Tax=Superficieibacter electus TaxID=2022662 RepID=A0A2P5GT51_9ENTR|nr:hypothetical protein [Superficieibacter electus]POP46265.1 hypothetical protein CHU33_05765 [Superficieibacter electus]POP49735.1 hypothetical protein CHU32_05780 [Superficieibacter electus]
MNPLHFMLKQVSIRHNAYLKKHSQSLKNHASELEPTLNADAWRDLNWHEDQSHHYSCLFRGGVLLSYTLGFLAVVFAVIPISGMLQDETLHHYGYIFVLLELMAIALIVAIYISGMSNKDNGSGRILFQNWRGKWQRHRTISEILRYQDAIAWLKPDNVIRKYNIPKEVLAASVPSTEAMLRCLQTLVSGQLSYNTQKKNEYHFIQHRLHAIAKWSFILTLLCCLAHFFIHSAALSALSAILPALGSCCHGIASTAEYEKLAQQCHQTKLLLDNFAQGLVTNEQRLLDDDAELRKKVKQFLDIVLDDRDKWYIFTSSSKLPL